MESNRLKSICEDIEFYTSDRDNTGDFIQLAACF